MAKDPDMPTTKEVYAIKEFIDEQVDADTAAERCTSRIRLEEKDPDPTLIWTLLESMSVKFPETQDKIVELLASIKKIPNPVRNGKEHKIYSEKTFSDLAYFGVSFCDFRSGLRDLNHGHSTPMKWACVNAYSARLTTNLVRDFRRYALETIEDGLDEHYLKESRTREWFLPAAANQIIFASYPLWNLRNDPEVTERMDAVFLWDRWRKEFEELAENSEVSKETRDLLHHAVDVMETVAQDPLRDDWQCRFEAARRAARDLE
ncbi:MAG: hypothetical protein Q9213_002330 [Squamulea squamosa]